MKTTRTTDVRDRALLVGLGLKRASRIPGQHSDDVARESLLELIEARFGPDSADIRARVGRLTAEAASARMKRLLTAASLDEFEL